VVVAGRCSGCRGCDRCSSAELVQVEGGDGWRFLVVGPVFDVEPLGSFLVVDQADLDGRLEQAGFNEGAEVDFDREAVLWVNDWGGVPTPVITDVRVVGDVVEVSLRGSSGASIGLGVLSSRAFTVDRSLLPESPFYIQFNDSDPELVLAGDLAS